MSRYINKDALVAEFKRLTLGENSLIERVFADGVYAVIETFPTADVVEVRHGEWEIKSRLYRMIDDFDEEIYVECPFCKRTFYVSYEFDDEKIIAYARENYPYCHCGAKMDGERN